MKLNLSGWSVALWVAVAAGAAGGSHSVAGPALCCRPLASETNYTDRSLFQLDSVWTSDAGRHVRLGLLRGRPQVVAMFFASCQFTCPLIVSCMQRIEAGLPENLRTNTGFLLVSFDSERDSPSALKAFRDARRLSKENWTLLRGEPDDVRELAALLGVIYRRDSKGEFAHSNLITVLDGEGEIAYQQAGFDLPPDAVVAKLKTIFSHEHAAN